MSTYREGFQPSEALSRQQQALSALHLGSRSGRADDVGGKVQPRPAEGRPSVTGRFLKASQCLLTVQSLLHHLDILLYLALGVGQDFLKLFEAIQHFT